MDRQDETPYNDRLFSGGLRRRLHLARFIWLNESLSRLNSPHDSILELGCFDGKLIDHLDNPPSRYVGLDADWEDGLSAGQERWADHDGYELRYCISPDEMELGDETFDISVCMETFEHVPPETVDPYLAALSAATRAYLFVTVPNEFGPVFLAKYAAKRVTGGDFQRHTPSELVNCTLGRTALVQRDEHKGFDYRILADQIGRHFDVIEVSGHPIHAIPSQLNFGVGIIAVPKKGRSAR